jgi:GAF domain-containing protein
VLKDKPALVPRRYYINLYEIAKAINSSLQVREVMNILARNTAMAVDAKGCVVLLLSPDKKRLWHGAAWGLSEAYINKGPISADASIAEAITEAHPVLVLKASEDGRIQYREEAKQEGVASVLSIPLVVEGEVVGVLRVYTSDPRIFPDEELNFLGAVADLAAIALQKARLFEWMRRQDIDVGRDLREWYASWE